MNDCIENLVALTSTPLYIKNAVLVTDVLYLYLITLRDWKPQTSTSISFFHMFLGPQVHSGSSRCVTTATLGLTSEFGFNTFKRKRTTSNSGAGFSVFELPLFRSRLGNNNTSLSYYFTFRIGAKVKTRKCLCEDLRFYCRQTRYGIKCNIDIINDDEHWRSWDRQTERPKAVKWTKIFPAVLVDWKNIKQDTQCTFNATLSRFRAIIVAVDKQ